MQFKPQRKLGFGLMRLPLNDPNDSANINIEELKKMVDLFLERGFTYFDTAWMYNGFNSENAAREALVERHPRESFTLADKLHSGFIETLEDRDKIFNEQLRKTGAGYFDYYLIHGIEAGMYEKYERLDCFGWLLQKKEEGLVRHCGFSFHDTPELLDHILSRYPQMEFVQLQINYLDWESEWIRSRECYEVCVKHDKPVVVMEPVKGGTLAKIPAEAAEAFKKQDPAMSIPSWAIRFVASLDNVMVVLSGMSNLEQLDDNTSYMQDFKKLSAEEVELCHKAADIINGKIAVPCTACHYCTEGCPMSIAIPEYFSLYNEDMREDLEQKGWTINFSNYENLSHKFGKASDCIECGQCEGVCPQHLPIIELLKDVKKHFEH
ncbi:MAG: aldo/keto reductase [Erysipelotrichaceae bacterium]|nr:aldo/keto reductase [Erysipelotrichaceae bacterium]